MGRVAVTPTALVALDATVRVERGDFSLDVSIAAPASTTVAILGPNGAGKSTFLRTIAGLAPIDGGRIEIDGSVVDDASAAIFVPAERRRVALVFQQYLLFPHLSALDNVAFGLRARRVGRADARRRAQEALDAVGLAPLARRRPHELSGGEAQRVALARALVTDPEVLLLDEPLAALDVSTRASVRRDLARRLDDHRGARLVVTHDPVEAAALANDVVVIEGGRVVQRGTPAELAARPRSRYVADLVGVNFLTGTARRGVIDVDDDGTNVATVVAADAVDGEVVVAIHPRSVVVHLTRPEGTARNVWQGRVASIDPEGDRVRVVVDGPLRLVAEVTPAAVAALALSTGAAVWVSVKATEVTVFPR